ncbi:MAG: carbon-nitrogen hydrolase family protein [Armatimonadota bacterium]|nr:carbon-nitrogen hydrolase family protein [Armatimonadota bacterium]
MSHFTAVVAIAAALTLLTCAEVCAKPHPGLKVSMVQIRVEDGDIDGNMRRAEEGIRESVARGVDLVCIPEAADWGWLYQQARRDAYPIPGRYTDHLAKLAKELNVWISAGCLEKDGDKTYNSAVIINRRGKIVIKHRKISTLRNLTKHLYDEGNVKDLKTVDTEFGRIGLTICADNFNIAIPKKVAEMGAWLLITPHGFAAKSGNLKENSEDYKQHIRNIAKESKMWVIGTDTVLGKVAGGNWKGQWHTGCSTIADPEGNAAVVAQFLRPDLVFYDIPAEK